MFDSALDMIPFFETKKFTVFNSVINTQKVEQHCTQREDIQLDQLRTMQFS